MIGHGIFLRSDGHYDVYVGIQDDTIYCGPYGSEEHARERWVNMVKTYNGYTPDRNEVKLYSYEKPQSKKKASVKKPAMKFEFLQNHYGYWLWRLLAKDGTILGESESSHYRLASCRKVVKSIIKNMPNAEIVEVERTKK